MLVDAFPDAFLEGGFKQHIMKGASDQSSVKETDELVCFQPNSVFVPGVLIRPLEERTHSAVALEAQSPWVFFCVGHGHTQRVRSFDPNDLLSPVTCNGSETLLVQS